MKRFLRFYVQAKTKGEKTKNWYIYKILMFVIIFFRRTCIQGFESPYLHLVINFKGGELGLAANKEEKKRALTIALNGNEFVKNAKALAFESYSLAPVTA